MAALRAGPPVRTEHYPCLLREYGPDRAGGFIPPGNGGSSLFGPILPTPCGGFLIRSPRSLQP